MTDQNAAHPEVGLIEIDAARRAVWQDGRRIALGARAFDLLLYLALRPGQTVTAEQLQAAVWPGRVVEASNLRVQINRVRQALGFELIVNMPGQGYRFHGRVRQRLNLPEIELPIGREAEAQALASLIGRVRMVTIVGAGGIGKTRLARAWFDQLSDGPGRRRAWLDLAPLPRGTPLLPALAAELRLPAPVAGVAGVAGAAWSLARVSQALADRPPLWLVLDNAEPHADALAQALPSWLGALPGLRLVLTSQVPLRLPEEHLLRLTGLAVPPVHATLAQARAQGAVALFEARARAAMPDFRLDAASLPQVVDLCRRLDGLPLAIELAAARLPSLGLTALLAALDERLHLLSADLGAVPARQRTLRAALNWTHALLDAPAQQVFARLAVFGAPFTATAAQAVVAEADGTPLDRWTVLRAVQTLVDTSLLWRDLGDPPQFRWLETPRLLAWERLQASGDEAAMRQRHRRWLDGQSARAGAVPEAEAAGAGPVDPAPAAVPPGPSGDPTAAPWLAQLQTEALRAATEHAGLNAATLAALAERLLPAGRQTLGVARAELARAVELAAQMVAAHGPGAFDDLQAETDTDGAGPTAPLAAGQATPSPAPDLSDRPDPSALLADQALGDMAESTRAGRLDAALEPLDDALAELARREARQAEIWRAARRRLLDGALRVELLRRQPAAAAERIEDLLTLDAPVAPWAGAAWLAHERHHLLLGRQQASWLNLEVAIALARRRLAAAQLPGSAPGAATAAQAALVEGLFYLGREQTGPEILREALATARAALAAVADAPAAADPAQTAALQAVMARVLAELGRRGSDNGLLDEALAVADTVLASPHADQHLALWLEAQRARALALLWLGARDVDDHRLQAAIAAFQLALHRLPADGAPDEWAWLRQQCGTAMSIAASHARGTAAREAAIAFHRETLARLSVADQPVEWAGVQNLLGIDLNFLSNAQTDHPAERERLLREAIQAFACQLDVLQRDTQPQRWANTQHNLAMGLANLGDCLRDPAPMHDAASRFREVLTVLTLAVYPSAHASVQNELAFALARAADLDPDADRRRWLLDEALAAIQVALDVRQRDRMPVEWARSQCDLGMVRVLQSRHAPDAATARLRADEARIALDEVLAAVAEADEPDLVERARDWRAQSLALLAAPPGSPPA